MQRAVFLAAATRRAHGVVNEAICHIIPSLGGRLPSRLGLTRKHGPNDGNLSEHNHESECRQHVIYSSQIRIFLVDRQINQYEQSDDEDSEGDKAQRLRLHADLHIAPNKRGNLIDLGFVTILAGKAAIALRATGRTQSTLAMFAKADGVDARMVEALQVGRPTNRMSKLG
jgi:hypothetical protein